jgi:hypothetical protein
MAVVSKVDPVLDAINELGIDAPVYAAVRETECCGNVLTLAWRCTMTRFQTVCLGSLSVVALFLAPHTTIAQPTEQERSVRGKINKLLSEPMKPAPGDDAVRQLFKDRYNAALDLLKVQIEQFAAGHANVTANSFVDAMDQVLRARRELTDKPADLLPLLQLRFELARDAQTRADAQFRSGLIGPASIPAARIVRIDAEIDLLRMQKRASTEKRP